MKKLCCDCIGSQLSREQAKKGLKRRGFRKSRMDSSRHIKEKTMRTGTEPTDFSEEDVIEKDS